MDHGSNLVLKIFVFISMKYEEYILLVFIMCILYTTNIHSNPLSSLSRANIPIYKLHVAPSMSFSIYTIQTCNTIFHYSIQVNYTCSQIRVNIPFIEIHVVPSNSFTLYYKKLLVAPSINY